MKKLILIVIGIVISTIGCSQQHPNLIGMWIYSDSVHNEMDVLHFEAKSICHEIRMKMTSKNFDYDTSSDGTYKIRNNLLIITWRDKHIERRKIISVSEAGIVLDDKFYFKSLGWEDDNFYIGPK